jgi:hypothetical protein
LSAVALVGMDGFAVTAHVHREGELWLAVETTQGRAWCSGCGVRATGNGRRRVLVRDLPIAGVPTVLVWAKRTWRCGETACPRGSWSETSSRQGSGGATGSTWSIQHPTRHATLDRQHPPFEIAVPQRGELTAASPRVGADPDDQQGLLGAEQQPTPAQRGQSSAKAADRRATSRSAADSIRCTSSTV